jgi:uncharacterized integral membrane protein
MTNPANEAPDEPRRTSPIAGGIMPELPPTEGAGLPGPADAATSTAPAAGAPMTSAESAVTAASTQPAPGFDHRGRVRSSRVSGVWIGLIGTALFLILLIIFIAQNSHRVSVHFLGWHGRFSLALTILLSAVIGLLLVAIPGTVRIIQLRRALRKNGPRTG